MAIIVSPNIFEDCSARPNGAALAVAKGNALELVTYSDARSCVRPNGATLAVLRCSLPPLTDEGGAKAERGQRPGIRGRNELCKP